MIGNISFDKVGQSLLEIREMCTSRQNCAANVKEFRLDEERFIEIDGENRIDKDIFIQAGRTVLLMKDNSYRPKTKRSLLIESRRRISSRNSTK